MARRTDFRKALTYSGQKIKGPAVISYKIDGCRVLYRDGKFVSRNDKPYPGLEIALTENAKERIRMYGDCEIYLNNFKITNGLLQRHNPEPDIITKYNIYPLVELDSRLILAEVKNVVDFRIEDMLYDALALGYEGLVIRTEDRWYRVKPTRTADVYITGWFEQLDKHKVVKGVLGGFTTNYGNVTAFTDEMRKELWDNPEQYVGRLMACQYKERYDTGSFRYAVKFLHFRDDKDEESFDE